MRRKTRDLVAALLVVAVLVPYVWYLTTGQWPTSIGDFGGMAFVGLVLGVGALMLQTSGEPDSRAARLEKGAVLGVMVLGLLALVLSETTAAAVLLAVFMVGVLVVWSLDTADHAGLVPRPARVA